MSTASSSPSDPLDMYLCKLESDVIGMESEPLLASTLVKTDVHHSFTQVLPMSRDMDALSSDELLHFIENGGNKNAVREMLYSAIDQQQNRETN